jgi:Secretion system C-terminal sorting domain
VYGANVQNGDYNVLVSNNGSLAYPSYSRLDNVLLHEFYNNTNNTGDLYIQGVAPNRIQSDGTNYVGFIGEHVWGTWFANGTRSLVVGTETVDAAALGLTAQPNPVNDALQIGFELSAPARVQLSVTNLLGQTILVRNLDAASGRNTADLNLGNFPAGTYVIRIATGNSTAALKVVKN